jgi:hypothetical protein
MSKQINIRLDEVHLMLLERMAEKLADEGVKTNKTDVIQKALYSFARSTVLGAEETGKIIDNHYSGIYKGLDLGDGKG